MKMQYWDENKKEWIYIEDCNVEDIKWDHALAIGPNDLGEVEFIKNGLSDSSIQN